MFFWQTVLSGSTPLQGQKNWEQTCSEYLGIFNIWEMQFKVKNTKPAASSLHSSQGQCTRKQCFMSSWVFFHAKCLPSIWLQMHKQGLTNALIQKENRSINIATYCLTKVKLKKSFSQYNFVLHPTYRILQFISPESYFRPPWSKPRERYCFDWGVLFFSPQGTWNVSSYHPYFHTIVHTYKLYSYYNL